MNQHGVIFITTNMINGKQYTGQSTKIKDVIQGKYKGSGDLIIKAFKKYGFKNFKSEIQEYVFSQEELNDKEIYWIEKNKSLVEHGGYNIKRGGEQGGKGNKMPESAKKTLSDLNKGEKK
jgi:group I intron endonuclease